MEEASSVAMQSAEGLSEISFVIIAVLSCSLYVMYQLHYTHPLITSYSLTIDNHTTIGMNSLPTNHRAIRTSQEYHHTSHLRRLSRPAHGRCEAVLLLFTHGRCDEWRPDRTRRNGIHANLLVDELVRETAGEGYDGSLCGSVVEEIGTADVGVYGGVVDYYSAAGVFEEGWEGGLGEVEEGYIIIVNRERWVSSGGD